MSFQNRLLEVTPAAVQVILEESEANHALATAEAARANLERNEAYKRFRDASRQAVNAVCGDEGIPISQRAAWSAAFHNSKQPKDGAITLEAFAQRAETYHNVLTDIDERLKEPGTPILWFFQTGFVGNRGSGTGTMSCDYRQGDGSGLQYKQEFNNMEKHYFHIVSAAEQAHPSGYKPGERPEPPLVCSSANGLMQKIVTIDEAAGLLKWGDKEPRKAIVIGSAAINAMFAAVGDTPRSAMLLGHAMYQGFEPEF